MTGGGGFIGANLLKRLLQEHSVALILRDTSDVWRISDVIKQCQVVHTDITDYRSLVVETKKIIGKIDAIVHLASYGVVTRNFDLDLGIKTNVFGTTNLLRLSHLSGVKKFINTGSCFEYAPSAERYREDSVIGPHTLYGGTKAASTSLVTAFAKSNDYNAFTLRLFTPYGPFEDPHRFVPAVILSVLNNDELNASNPESVRDYIYVDDVVSAYLKSIRTDKNLSGEVINIGSGKEYKLSEIVSAVEHVTKNKVKILWKTRNETRKSENISWRSINTKAKQMLGWKPESSFIDSISLTYNWFKNNSFVYDIYR